MLIHDMSAQDCTALLARARLGRLACACEGQPYITPISFAHDAGFLYSFSTLGKKIQWMRTNPLVCVEVEELATSQDWSTVIVTGKYEELPDTPEYEIRRRRAYDLLRRRPAWWEPGYVKTVVDGKIRPIEATYFRIVIDHVSGRRGLPDAAPGRMSSASREPGAGWLRRIFADASR